MNTQCPWLDKDWVNHTQLMLDSFRHCLGYDLVSRRNSCDLQARYLFKAPLIVVSHDTQMDPVLNYGNQAALDLWEMDLPNLLVTPSRKTAEPVHRDERALLMERTRNNGYVDDYHGMRISHTGRRFWIETAIVWNLYSSSGRYAGQAATFSRWKYPDL